MIKHHLLASLVREETAPNTHRAQRLACEPARVWFAHSREPQRCRVETSSSAKAALSHKVAFVQGGHKATLCAPVYTNRRAGSEGCADSISCALISRRKARAKACILPVRERSRCTTPEAICGGSCPRERFSGAPARVRLARALFTQHLCCFELYTSRTPQRAFSRHPKLSKILVVQAFS